MNSPTAKAYLAILARIAEQVPEIVYITHDLGQLDDYSAGKPPVAFPCALIDFDQWGFGNLGDSAQTAEGDVVIKLGFALVGDTSNAQPLEWQEAAMQYYDIEWKLNKALHGWSPGDEFGTLTRTFETKENRPAYVRQKTLRYRLAYEDYSVTPEDETIPRPGVIITPED